MKAFAIWWGFAFIELISLHDHNFPSAQRGSGRCIAHFTFQAPLDFRQFTGSREVRVHRHVAVHHARALKVSHFAVQFRVVQSIV
jgi:hypothetical protein